VLFVLIGSYFSVFMFQAVVFMEETKWWALVYDVNGKLTSFSFLFSYFSWNCGID